MPLPDRPLPSPAEPRRSSPLLPGPSHRCRRVPVPSRFSSFSVLPPWLLLRRRTGPYGKTEPLWSPSGWEASPGGGPPAPRRFLKGENRHRHRRGASGCGVPLPGRGRGVCVLGGGGIPVPSPAGEGAPGVVVGFGRPGGEPPPFPAGPATEPRGGRESRARPCAVVGCARPGALFTCPKTVLKGRVGIAFQRGKAKKPGRRRPRSAGRHRVRACGRARSGGQGLGVSVEPLAGWKFRERRSKVSALSRVSHLLTDANNVSLSEQRYRSSESRC